MLKVRGCSLLGSSVCAAGQSLFYVPDFLSSLASPEMGELCSTVDMNANRLLCIDTFLLCCSLGRSTGSR